MKDINILHFNTCFVLISNILLGKILKFNKNFNQMKISYYLFKLSKIIIMPKKLLYNFYF